MAVCLSVKGEQWQVWKEIEMLERGREGLVLCEECNGERANTLRTEWLPVFKGHRRRERLFCPSLLLTPPCFYFLGYACKI